MTAVEPPLPFPPDSNGRPAGTGGGRAKDRELEHEWVVAGLVPIDPEKVARAARNRSFEIPEKTYIRAVDVFCESCRQPFATARDTKCTPYADVLRGGPPDGTRRKRGDVAGGDDEAVTED